MVHVWDRYGIICVRNGPQLIASRPSFYNMKQLVDYLPLSDCSYCIAQHEKQKQPLATISPEMKKKNKNRTQQI